MSTPVTLAEIAADAAAGMSEADLAARLDQYSREQDAAYLEAQRIASESTVHHIRRSAGPSLGRPGYSHRHVAQFRAGYVDPSSLTLCGAPSTGFDMSWAETRYPSSRAHVTCDRCLDLRPVSTSSSKAGR